MIRPPPKRLRLIVGPAEAGTPLVALLTVRGGLTPALAASALAAGGVMVNNKRVTSPTQSLKLRDEVVAHLAERGAPARGPRPLDEKRILLLDQQIIVVDKPSGVAAQGTNVDAAAGLDAAVSALLKARGEANTFVGLVHRLDLETTGLTVFARTPEALRHLSDQFRDGLVKKRYLALVEGVPAFEEKLADGPIAADPERQGSYLVSPRGRIAKTLFRRLETFARAPTPSALLECLPTTGRTHQIRVHARALGHVLLGDKRYGGPTFATNPDGSRIAFPRVLLHASDATLTHPNGKPLVLKAPIAADFEEIRTALAAA